MHAVELTSPLHEDKVKARMLMEEIRDDYKKQGYFVGPFSPKIRKLEENGITKWYYELTLWKFK